MSIHFPLVSIIITSYNRGGMISKAIESALEQDYPEIEIIISDNCSTDNSDEVIKKYLYDKRIKYNRNSENLGMVNNFRLAFYSLSKGSYVTFVSSDDYLTDKSFISDAIKLINRDPLIESVHGRLAFNSTSNNVLWEMPSEPFFETEIWNGKDVFFTSMKTSGLLSWGACLLNRAALFRVGCLMNDYHNADFDGSYKLMLTSNVGFIDRICYMQVGHYENNGFPANSEKLIKSLECFENVARYALSVMPDKEYEIREWKEHFILYTVNISMYSLIEKDKEQFSLFKSKVSQLYPELYKRHTTGWGYKKMVLLHPIKKLFHPRFRTKIRQFFTGK